MTTAARGFARDTLENRTDPYCGHTDSQGDNDKNQLLSEKRAQASVDFLVQKGVAQERLLTAGFGETKPIASNKTAKGRTLNRRVEFELVFPK